MEVSHLLFVDDTNFFENVNQEKLEYLSKKFMWFEIILGFKNKMEKHQLIPISKVAMRRVLLWC